MLNLSPSTSSLLAPDPHQGNDLQSTPGPSGPVVHTLGNVHKASPNTCSRGDGTTIDSLQNSNNRGSPNVGGYPDRDPNAGWNLCQNPKPGFNPDRNANSGSAKSQHWTQPSPESQRWPELRHRRKSNLGRNRKPISDTPLKPEPFPEP